MCLWIMQHKKYLSLMDLVTKLYQITFQQTNEWHSVVNDNIQINTNIYAGIEGRIIISKGKPE